MEHLWNLLEQVGLALLVPMAALIGPALGALLVQSLRERAQKIKTAKLKVEEAKLKIAGDVRAQVEIIASLAVESAEQQIPAEDNLNKKGFAMKLARALLDHDHIEYPEYLLSGIVEAKVGELPPSPATCLTV